MKEKNKLIKLVLELKGFTFTLSALLISGKYIHLLDYSKLSIPGVIVIQDLKLLLTGVLDGFGVSSTVPLLFETFYQ